MDLLVCMVVGGGFGALIVVMLRKNSWDEWGDGKSGQSKNF
jgi:hypothetical protein